LVLLYSLLYYRVLGLLTALSLVASGAMVFAILVLLDRYINYTLDLAGIAGLIIGIGTTADSFVVFFERIKDEIREGRSFRSAVPRGWARARKTILSGNAVTFLAALVLYILAVGQVKGFAFTLGLTTILDVVVDSYAPVVAEVERDIDQIEATVFSGAVAPTERIYSLRREATDFYRAVHPLLAVVSSVERLVPGELKPYLHDVSDNLLLVNEEVAAQRDTLGSVLEANMAVITVEQTRVNIRQNATIEQLTILATVFLPLTFITGFFGQNFRWLVDHVEGLPEFLAFGIGGLIIPLILLFLWLRYHRRRIAETATVPGS